MILIISSNDDACTSLVLDWLMFYGSDFKRVSSEKKIKIIHLNVGDFGDTEIQLGSEVYFIKEFTSIWYRRSQLAFDEIDFVTFSEPKMTASINAQIQSEYKVLIEYFLTELKKRSLNSQIDNSLNKLTALSICKSIDIKVPDTIVTTKKTEILNFMRKWGNIITKNFTPGVWLHNDDVRLGSGTILLTEQMIQSLPDTFIPMMFQNMIEKAFELRVFYIQDRLFASAIFSQNDEKTKIDFRNYNFDKPNRTPPFSLSTDLTNQLKDLMRILDLNCGSIDLLVSTTGEIYFLEVNPVGQFFQVSYPCNYYLEKQVATTLSKYELN